MNRRFRLHTLHRLRERRLDAAAGDLAQARRALAEAQEQELALVGALADCVAPDRAAPDDLVRAALHRDLLRQRVRQAGELVRRRQGELGAALEAWHGARAELRAVEVLRERHRLAVAEDDARREQREADDLASVAVLHRSSAHPASGPGRRPSGGDAA